MSLSRRQFCQWLSAVGTAMTPAFGPASARALVQALQSDSHLGNRYPFVQKQADRSPLELSFLRSESRNLERWQKRSRANVCEHLFYGPPSVSPAPELVRRTDKGDYDRRSQQSEQLVARSLLTAGITWAGVILWDDIRTLDYLASRPEVDARRLGCVGLSVGGYRSFLLAALDRRIKVAVDVGWMTSY